MTAQRIPFSPQDEEKINSAALWGTIAGITAIASAVLSIVMQLIVGKANVAAVAGAFVGGSISLAINVILAVWLLQASAAFRKVATTDVADEAYLLHGFTKLRNYFMMTGILFIIAVSLAGLAMLAALTCGMALMR